MIIDNMDNPSPEIMKLINELKEVEGINPYSMFIAIMYGHGLFYISESNWDDIRHKYEKLTGEFLPKASVPKITQILQGNATTITEARKYYFDQQFLMFANEMHHIHVNTN